MAISFDNSGQNITTNTDTNTFNLTIGSGSDRIVFVSLVWVETSIITPVAIDSLTVDGSSATLIDILVYFDPLLSWTVVNSLWYSAAPSVGSVAITGVLSGAITAFVMRASSYFGAKQSSPINAFASDFNLSGASLTYTEGVTPSVAGCWGVAGFENHSLDIISATGCVIREGASTGVVLVDSNAALTQSVNNDFTVGVASGSPVWSGVMAAFEPAGAAPAGGNYYGQVGYY